MNLLSHQFPKLYRAGRSWDAPCGAHVHPQAYLGGRVKGPCPPKSNQEEAKVSYGPPKMPRNSCFQVKNSKKFGPSARCPFPIYLLQYFFDKMFQILPKTAKKNGTCCAKSSISDIFMEKKGKKLTRYAGLNCNYH